MTRYTEKTSPCACDARYEECDHSNPCLAPNDGTGRGPWCADCNPQRIAAIRVSLELLRLDFGGGS